MLFSFKIYQPKFKGTATDMRYFARVNSLGVYLTMKTLALHDKYFLS